MSLHPVALMSFSQMVHCQLPIQGRPGNLVFPALRSKSLSNLLVQPNILLRLTARIGLPLYFCWSIAFQLMASHDDGLLPGGISFVDHPNNPVLGLFSMRKRPDGVVDRHSVQGIPRPNILLSRADGKELRPDEVALMYYFIRSTMKSVAEMLHLSDVQKSDTFFGKMTPENFANFWNGQEPNLECPVKLGCNACGVRYGATRVCGECGVVKYCSQQCQENDRIYHTRVCVRET